MAKARVRTARSVVKALARMSEVEDVVMLAPIRAAIVAELAGEEPVEAARKALLGSLADHLAPPVLRRPSTVDDLVKALSDLKLDRLDPRTQEAAVVAIVAELGGYDPIEDVRAFLKPRASTPGDLEEARIARSLLHQFLVN